MLIFRDINFERLQLHESVIRAHHQSQHVDMKSSRSLRDIAGVSYGSEAAMDAAAQQGVCHRLITALPEWPSRLDQRICQWPGSGIAV